jgi:molecular chaperone GrpE
MTEKRKEDSKEPETKVEYARGEPVEPTNARTDIDQLVDKLLQQKDEHFEQVFLTKEDNDLIDSLPEEQRESVREALLQKGALFRKLQEKLLRVSADYANYQKRIPKQISDTIAYEKEKIIRTLLPALDNLEHTLQKAHTVENVDDFIKGVQIINDQMLSILQSHGVEQIHARGEKFDPTLHEAMLRKTEPQQEDNLVLEEFQKGYKVNGRVIRPSRVIVNKWLGHKLPAEQTDIEDETIDTQ